MVPCLIVDYWTNSSMILFDGNEDDEAQATAFSDVRAPEPRDMRNEGEKMRDNECKLQNKCGY